MYLDALPVSFFLQTTLVILVFDHDLLESLQFLELSFLHFLLLNRNLLFDFLDEQMVELVFLLLLNFLALGLVLDLPVPHLFFELDLAFVFFFFLSFALIIGLCLFDL
jgi:hypothetical protein